MTNKNKILLLPVMLVLLLLMTSCGKPLFPKKDNCGCPDKKRMVGY